MFKSYEIILCDEDGNLLSKEFASSVESAFSFAESYEDFWAEGEGWIVRGIQASKEWVELGSKWCG